MLRLTGALLAGLTALLLLSNVRAADAVPSGTYKVYLPFLEPERPLWLFKFTTEKDKTTATVLAKAEGVQLPELTIDDIKTDDGILRFTGKMGRGGDLKFELKLPKEKKGKMLGSAVLTGRDQVMAAELEPTSLTALDFYSVNKDRFPNLPVGPTAVPVALALIDAAVEKKATVEEVTAWADKAIKSAEPYGDRLLRDTLLQVIEPLGAKETYAKVALPYAERAAKMIAKGDSIATQKRILGLLGDLYEKAGKVDEAKEVRARDAKLQYVTPTSFPGRKAKSDRVVLVELFTGAQCPPCVAADLAFDGLDTTYKPSEIVLLQYHLHIPGPDPMTNADTQLRQTYYGSRTTVKGTPTILFNGRAQASGGGSFDQAQEKYKEYTEVINPLLEKAARGKIALTAKQKGDKIDIKADVSDLEETGDEVRLRLVLVEKAVEYRGSNKLRVHHHVVRAFPGGTAGMAMKEKKGSKSVTVDLADLKKKLTEFLEKGNEDNPTPERPMALKNFAVVAFVQNDDTQEVLQATQVDVKEE